MTLKPNGGTVRFTLPDSNIGISGFKDSDQEILASGLSLKDRVAYLNFRLDFIFFKPLDQIYTASSPHHDIVNDCPTKSFYLMGTTLVCCSIEALGSFVSGKKSGEAFSSFIASYMKEWNTKTASVNVCDWLWTNLRIGLAHDLGIRNGGTEIMGTVRFKENQYGELFIHPDLLYQDLKNGRDLYFADIVAGSDQMLVNRFKKTFKRIFLS